jgi:cellulose synthase operon protein C
MIRRYLLPACVLVSLVLTSGCGYFTTPEKRVARAETLVAQGRHREALIELRNAQEAKSGMPQVSLLLAEVALWSGDPAAAERELRAVPENHEPARRADVGTRVDLASRRFAEVLARIGTPASDAPAVTWLYRGLANQGLGNFADAESDFRAAVGRDAKLVAAHVGIVEMRAAQNDVDDALNRSRDLLRDYPESASVWFVRGAMLVGTASLSEAQQALESALKLAPRQFDIIKQVSLLVMLTEVQIANREIEKARASAASLGRVASGSPVAALASARVLMAADDFAGAAVELRRIVNRVPQFTHARFMLAVSLAAQGLLAQANQELTRVVDEVPNNMEARQLLAQVRMRLDDPDSALRVLVPALDRAGDGRAINKLFEAASAQVGDDTRSLALMEREYQKSPENQGLKLQLAAAYVRAEQGAKALALLRGGKPAASDLDTARVLLAAIAQVEGDEAARRQLESMRVAQPNNVGLVLLAAQMHLAVREDQRARQMISDAITRNPQDEGLRLALARVQLVSGERDAAVETLTKLRQGNPKATDARLLLAQLALARDNPKEAATLIAEAVQGTDRMAETRNAAALLYLGTARYDAAIEHLLAGIEADSNDPTLWLNLGRAQLALQRHEAARASLLRALSFRAKWLPAEGALAFLDIQLGNSVAALKRIDALRTARPHDAQVLALDADVNAALGRYNEADRSLTQAARVQPSGDLALKHYRMRMAGELANPTEPLEKWVESHRDDLPARRALGEAHARAGARDLAVQQYEAIVSSEPRDAVSMNNLAWLYFERGDKRSVETARRAAALAPNSPAIADTLGWLLVQSGAVGEGLEVLERASLSDPRNGDMQYHYAAALAKAGKPADAQKRLGALLARPDEFTSRAQAQELLDRLNKAQP